MILNLHGVTIEQNNIILLFREIRLEIMCFLDPSFIDIIPSTWHSNIPYESCLKFFQYSAQYWNNKHFDNIFYRKKDFFSWSDLYLENKFIPFLANLHSKHYEYLWRHYEEDIWKLKSRLSLDLIWWYKYFLFFINVLLKYKGKIKSRIKFFY